MKEMVNMIANAYIEIMGIEKWNALTEEQKHDVVMIMAQDAMKALDKVEERA